MFGEVTSTVSFRGNFVKVLPILAMLSLLILPLSMSASAITRAEDGPILYLGNVDGEGDDNDLVLAGHRWYTCSFTFLNWIDQIYDSKVTMTYNETVKVDLFRYVPSTETLTVLDDSGHVEVRNPQITIQQGANLTLSFEIWVHLSWPHSSEVKLEPEIWNGTSQVDLDSTNLLRFDIKGELKVIQDRIRVLDNMSRRLISGEDVGAGSMITVTGIKFSYVDSLDRFDDLSPQGDEFIPVVTYDDMEFNAVFGSDVYNCDVVVPDIGDGKVDLSITIPGIRSQWIFAVDNWRFSIDIDGIGPKIDLMDPIKDDQVGEPTFNWTVKITDRPSPQDVTVNGSRVSYRVWTSFSWATRVRGPGGYSSIKSRYSASARWSASSLPSRSSTLS